MGNRLGALTILLAAALLLALGSLIFCSPCFPGLTPFPSFLFYLCVFAAGWVVIALTTILIACTPSEQPLDPSVVGCRRVALGAVVVATLGVWWSGPWWADVLTAALAITALLAVRRWR